jgi:hypothetical protein
MQRVKTRKEVFCFVPLCLCAYVPCFALCLCAFQLCACIVLRTSVFFHTKVAVTSPKVENFAVYVAPFSTGKIGVRVPVMMT